MLLFIAALVVVAAASPSDMKPLVAAHHGRLDGDRLVWSSTVDLGVLAAGGDRVEVPLLRPLPQDARVEGAAAVRADDGSIRAMEFTARSKPYGRQALEAAAAPQALQPLQSFEVSVAHRLDAAVVPAPLLGAGVERLSFDALRFEADAALGLRAHLGYTADDAVERGDRKLVERRLNLDDVAGSIYLSPTQALASMGLRGRLVEVAAERQQLAVGALGITLALAAALLFAYRRLRAAVSEERVDKVIGGELDTL